jgi:hypothetical protein
MALRGDEQLVNALARGARALCDTQRYLREAETLGRDGGQPFPPLAPELLESRRNQSAVPNAR